MKRATPWLLLALLVTLCFCLVCLLAFIAIFAPEWLPVGFPGISRDRVVIQVADRRQEADYYLLRPGQDLQRGLLLADDALLRQATEFTQQTEWGRQTAEGFVYGPLGFGAFLPESQALLYSVQTEDGTSLNWLGRRGAAPRTVHETNGSISTVLTLEERQTVFLIEDTGTGRVRCYISRGGEEAERVARGDSCRVSSDGSTLLVSDGAADSLTLTAYNLDGSDAQVLLDEEEDTDGSSRLSPDGRRVAYVASDGERFNVVVLSRQDGRVLAEGEHFYRVLDYEFSPQGSLLFVIGETEEGDLTLSLLDEQSQSIASGQTLEASFSPDGRYLVYLTGDEAEDETLTVHSLSGGEDIEVLEEGDLAFVLPQGTDSLLISQILEGEAIFYNAEVSGADLDELFSVDQLSGIQVFKVPEDPRFFALAIDGEGRHLLYVGPSGETPGYELLDDWVAINPLGLSPDGRTLAFAGQEDLSDPWALYVVELADGASPVQLDEDMEGIQNTAFFTDNGREVLYTALTGSDIDETEVRRVHIRGDRPYEVLYTEAVLETVFWETVNPFNSRPLSFRTGLAASSLCPGSPTLAAGEEVEDRLEPGGRNCYRFRAGPSLDYRIGVTTGDMGLDSRMEIYDRQGTLIGSDDDGGPGLSPRLALTLEEGALYYIYIFGYSDDDSGVYSLTVSEGLPGSLEEEAVLLPFDETVRGAITSESEVFIEEFNTSLSAAVYYFNAQRDDWIIVDTSARSLGSSLEPIVALFDVNMQALTFAEPDREGQLQLAYSIPTNGRYYLLVLSADEGYGTADDHFFDITLTLGTPPGTVEDEAVLLPYDETVHGAITAENVVLTEQFGVTFAAAYYFDAEPEDWIVVDLTAGSTGSSLYPMMTLLDDNSSILTLADPDIDGDAQLAYSIPSAGRYYLLVRSGDQSYGTIEDYFFDITLTLGTPPVPGGGPIEVGETVSGNLQSTIHDEWTFTAEARDYVTISMTSDAFDTYLELYDPFGVQIAYNDDSGGDLNSLISDVRLPTAGTYTIRARSYSGRSSGPYTLSLTAGEADTTTGGTITPGEPVEGDLRPNSQDEWTFNGRAGHRVTIMMWSDEIDPYLTLLGPNGDELISDDDGAGYPNAMIEEFELPVTGIYTIIARSFGGSRSGGYVLSLEETAQ